MLRALLLSILTFACPSAVQAAGGGAPADSLLVSAVSIVDMENGTVSRPSDILIANGRIVEVASAGTIDRSRASAIVEAEGTFALPGLIDVHAHLGDGGAGAQTAEDRERALPQFLRYGVTTIFVPGGTGGNDDQLVEWRRRCAVGELACPGLYGSGAIITAVGSHPITTIFGLPADVDAATAYQVGTTAVRPGDDISGLVASKVAKGADAIKIVIEDGPPPWYPKPRLGDGEIAAIVDAAHARDVPVYAHVGRAAHVAAGLAAGIDGIMHSPLDPVPDAMLQEMAREQVFYVATLALYDGIHDWTAGRGEEDPFALAGITPRAAATLADPAFLGAAPESVAQAEAYVATSAANLRRAFAAGVPLALGTDTNNPFVYPGHAAHEELALMVQSGLEPAAALRAATIGGAAFLGRAGTLGRVAEGFEGDILIVGANPFVDIRNTRRIAHVVSDGRIVDNVVATADPIESRE